MRRVSALGALLLIGCDGAGVCDADGLSAELEGAKSADVVRVGACRIEGDFTLPAGVALVGEEGSVIAGRIDLSSGRIENLRVESTDAGIVARDGGTVSIRDVEVVATTGIGIAANTVARVELERVTLRGPIDASNVSSIQGSVPDNRTTATHGLIVENVPDAALSEISIRGFARFGALFKNSSTVWSGGDANENVWVGIMIDHGSATISDVEVNDTMDIRIAHAAAFGVVTGTAALDTTDLTVRRSEGFGVFHLMERATHENLTVSDSANTGVWLEKTMSAEISGTIANNDFGGIVAVVARDLRIHDAMIASSAKAMRNLGANGSLVEAGDGIQLFDSTTTTRIENTMITGNDRAGVVIHLVGQTLTPGLFDNVTVMRDDATENGVLVQGGARASGWDTGLVRDPATVQADEAFTDLLNPVGAVGPCFVPRN